MRKLPSSLDEIARLISSCTLCALHAYRKNPVPGEGNPDADLMLIGEAPGRTEDETGRPFVGQAGKILDEALAKAGLSREVVYITNVVKCRPPNNRDPRPEEVRACSPYLEAQVRIISPKVILTLGRHSTGLVFSWAGLPFRSIMAVRGRARRVEVLGLRVTVVPTVHPAACLYNPRLRPLLEEDVKLASRLSRGMGLEGSLELE
ncbi:MAG TPA: uracil-DNA glycosylase [Candidatus Korarchaeota archaeon]|nr:uracil-DNA glycosylase [Candidatus Korarchaeota archaeon]